MNKISLNKLVLISLISIASLFILGYLVAPRILGNKTLGSFEYVRRGEELLDKENYKKAIYYFERAFQSSPENKAIKTSLAWAYTRYSITLMESANYDTAIGYLTKAYRIMPDINTRQNLSLAYRKKAFIRAEKGEWYGAIEDFTSSREIASESRSVSKNLLISLFNDAVTSYKAGREKIAIMCLIEASLVDDDSRVFEFLGDIYYRRTDLENALFYWNRSLELYSGNAGLKEKLDKLSKEMELAKTEKERALPHFELRYERSLGIDVAAVSGILENAYLDIGRDLNYFPASKTIVFFYSEKDFRNIFKMPSIVRAFYDGNIRMPFPEDDLDKKELTTYLYHEYAHAVVSALTKNNCPVWFSEGTATWEGFEKNDKLAKDILLKTVENKEFSIASLGRAFDAGGKDMRLYYILSYTVVKYIVDNWGLGGLRDILKRVSSGQHIINAIDDRFLLSEKEFDKRWNAYVRQKFLN